MRASIPSKSTTRFFIQDPPNSLGAVRLIEETLQITTEFLVVGTLILGEMACQDKNVNIDANIPRGQSAVFKLFK
jgi:hypothetical protein